MSITAATLIGALAILAGSLVGALTTGWVQHRFWKHQERQKTRLTIADKIAQFYADLLFNWNLEHSSTDDERKREAAWRRESDMQLLAALSTQLASVFSNRALDDPFVGCRSANTVGDACGGKPGKSGSIEINWRSLRGSS